MSSQPPPPVPRRTDYTFVWVLLGVLLFGGLLLFSGIYIFSRYIARQVGMDIRDTGGGKSVNIETPAGSLQVKTGEIGEQELGLPIYPGARRQKKEGASISLEVPAEKTVRVVAAAFETDDPMEKVSEFYRWRLGGLVIERRNKDRLEFVVESGGRKKVVGLRRKFGRTEIALANITEGGVN